MNGIPTAKYQTVLCSFLPSFLYVSVAQRLERSPVKRNVLGSNPSGYAKRARLERPKGLSCNAGPKRRRSHMGVWRLQKASFYARLLL